MPKIASYATASPSITDKLIGSQDNAGEDTKNFDIGDVLQLGNQYFAPNDFGSFYDTTNQTVAANSIAALRYGHTVVSNNVSIDSDGSHPTLITMTNAGVYNIQFSAQLEKVSGGGDARIVFWLRLDGDDVPDSATSITIKSGSKYLVAAWNFFQAVNAGGKVQIMWTQDDNVAIPWLGENNIIPYPATPSVILTVNRVF